MVPISGLVLLLWKTKTEMLPYLRRRTTRSVWR